MISNKINRKQKKVQFSWPITSTGMNSKKFKQIGIEYNSSSQGKLQKDELEYANSIFVTAFSDR